MCWGTRQEIHSAQITVLHLGKACPQVTLGLTLEQGPPGWKGRMGMQEERPKRSLEEGRAGKKERGWLGRQKPDGEGWAGFDPQGLKRLSRGTFGLQTSPSVSSLERE